MTKEMLKQNYLEQNSPFSALDALVAKHIDAWEKRDRDAAERIRSYPASFSDYRELPTNERLTAAAGIMLCEVPVTGRGSRTLPDNPLSFDITSLTCTSIDTAVARMAYSEGDWINAMNDTHITRLPHISIEVEITKDARRSVSQFASLQIRQDYHGGGYSQYKGSKNHFYVIESDRAFKPHAIHDFEEPLFRDVITLIDTGVSVIYRDKIIPRATKLGQAAIGGAQ